MKRLSDRAKEPAGLWLARVDAARKLSADILAEREKYSLALSLRYNLPAELVGSDREIIDEITDGQHDVPYLFRYAQWLKSQAAGEAPYIEYPSNDGTPPEFSQFASTLIKKVLVDEAGAMDEWRDTMTRLAAFGAETVWYGFHADIVSADEAQAAGESLSEAFERAKRGDTDVREGQDHGMIAQLADRAAGAEDAHLSLSFEEQANLTEAMLKQVEAESELSDTPSEPRVVARRIWCRREPLGIRTFFDTSATKVSDIQWFSRDIYMRVEDAQNSPALRPDARKKLQGEVFKREEGFSEIDESKTGRTDENRRVRLTEIWDARSRSRHILCEELPEQYLENDESNPYVDREGEPVVPGFFPVVLVNPIKPDDESPRRLWGMPLVQPAWDQQREYNELRTLDLAGARKHSIRGYVLHPRIDPTGEFAETLSAGEDGFIVPCPEGLDNPRDAVFPVGFTGTPADLSIQARQILTDMSAALAWPLASMLGNSQADTATQEQLGVAAGNAQAADVLIQIQKGFAHGAEIVRGLIRAFYPAEKIASIVGPKYAEILEQWRGSELDGDTLIARFGAMQKEFEAVRLKQKMEAIKLALSIPHPLVPGLPIVDVTPVVMELFRDLSDTEPKAFEQAQLVIAQAVQEMQAKQKMQADAQQSVAKSETRKGIQESAQNPSLDHENSAAQRVR